MHSIMKRPTAVLILILSALSAAPAPADDGTAFAFLRVETGTHTARIMRMAADADCRFLVTASDDKTVRVWDAATGGLIRVIRPPMGEGYEGMVWGLAVSPDGSLIACGGATGEKWDGENHVYLFDRATGRMTARLAGVEGQINSIAWSPDGTLLAVGLSSGGLRLYTAPSWTLAAADRDYTGAVWGAGFHGSGDEALLAVSSTAGDVTLYRAWKGLQRVGRARTQGGKQAFDAAFSPDGSRLAVGYFDSAAVDVYGVNAGGAPGLARLYSPDTALAGMGMNFSRLCWSADGRSLYAAGTAQGGKTGSGGYILRRWGEAGRGAFADLVVSDSLITTLLPLKTGGVAFSDYGPGFCVVSAAGTVLYRTGPSIMDYRSLGRGFQVSEDATVVALGPSLRFSLSERVLTRVPDPSRRLSSARQDGLPVTDWRGSFSPALSGAPLDVGGDYSYCLAVDPSASSFVLGCEWSLQAFSRTGARLWLREAPASTLGVCLARDGKIVVAAFGDGTVRWYRAEDGAECMSLFPCVDGARWILWTPSGRYDCSPGAEDLVGWEVSTDPAAAADFFPCSRFRAARYRPDVLARILETPDEEEALRRADAEAGRTGDGKGFMSYLPPVVSVLSPSDGACLAGEAAIRYGIRSSGGEAITAVKILVDGRPVYVERGLSLKPSADGGGIGPRETVVALPEADCTVSVVAENAHAASVPASIRILRAAAAPTVAAPAAEEFTVPPRLYVLAIGVSEYADPKLRLEFSAKDARDFAHAMEAQQGGLFREVSARVLTNGMATRDDILDGLEWIQRETTSKDVAMIMLSGHGVNDSSGYYYYLPQNADLSRIKRTCVPFTDIKNTVAALAGKALFFIDTCHSGNVLGGRKGIADITGVVNELASAENGAIVFASSTGNQFSLEDAAWGNGAFTMALLEGLAGKADYRGRGVITVNMLDLWLSERVKELTDGQQTPTTAKPQTVQDFPVAVVGK
jgi:WD40 repeat protein